MSDLSKFRPVIIAGGSGTRFWPASRKAFPKQFIKFADRDLSLIQSVANKLENLVPQSEILIVTGKAYQNLCQEHVPEAKIISEPCPKNTAAAIGLATAALAAEDPTNVMMVAWSDAAIANVEEYKRVIEHAYQYIKDSDQLGVIAVEPEQAHTGYGYIEAGSEIIEGVKKVIKFYEKPDLKTAERFVSSGNFYWNPGIFIWRVDSVLKAFQKNMPDFHQSLQELISVWGSDRQESVTKEMFNKVESISIDYSILEKSDNLVLFPAYNLGWSDVGSWDIWADYHQADSDLNTFQGDVYSEASHNNLVRAEEGKFVALLGVDDLVVVDTKDALLVCKKDKAQKVKSIVEYLKLEGREDLT